MIIAVWLGCGWRKKVSLVVDVSREGWVQSGFAGQRHDIFSPHKTALRYYSNARCQPSLFFATETTLCSIMPWLHCTGATMS